MRPAIAASQRRVLRELLARLRPDWRKDPGLPARFERMLRADRRFGSRDRRLYRELVYTTLRHLPWIEPWLDSAPDFADEAVAWLAAETPATAAFRAALAGAWPPVPAGSGEKARFLEAAALGRHPPSRPLPLLVPEWCAVECPAALEPDQYEALQRRAPLWIRVQGEENPGQILAELAEQGWAPRAGGPLPGALRLEPEADLTAAPAYRRGAIEIQDLGSQLILASAAPAPGGRWLDACAGAGGKSLQLAGLLGPDGRVDVHDPRSAALDELEIRAKRAGLAARIRRVRGPDLALYDGVLVDAPCTGTGTWRRAPHLKWVTTPADVAASARRQADLLARFALAVRPGGRLVYATCSLCPRENEATARGFLAGHPEFQAETPPHSLTGRAAPPGFLFLPADHDGDGFFVASFRRRA